VFTRVLLRKVGYLSARAALLNKSFFSLKPNQIGKFLSFQWPANEKCIYESIEGDDETLWKGNPRPFQGVEKDSVN
jgi:hypothetical protein